MVKFKRHPKLKRLGEKWRRPRGSQSKLRKGKAGKGPVVAIGYRSPRAERGLHPTGFKPVLVRNVLELDKINPAKEAIIIASGVGKRKRRAIQQAAGEKNIKVLNLK